MTRHRPEPENNPELRPETQPECSLTRPIPVGLGWVGFSGGPGPCSVITWMNIYNVVPHFILKLRNKTL